MDCSFSPCTDNSGQHLQVAFHRWRNYVVLWFTWLPRALSYPVSFHFDEVSVQRGRDRLSQDPFHARFSQYVLQDQLGDYRARRLIQLGQETQAEALRLERENRNCNQKSVDLRKLNRGCTSSDCYLS